MLHQADWVIWLSYALYIPFAIGLLTSYVYGRYTTLKFESEIYKSSIWRYFNGRGE